MLRSNMIRPPAGCCMPHLVLHLQYQHSHEVVDGIPARRRAGVFPLLTVVVRSSLSWCVSNKITVTTAATLYDMAGTTTANLSVGLQPLRVTCNTSKLCATAKCLSKQQAACAQSHSANGTLYRCAPGTCGKGSTSGQPHEFQCHLQRTHARWL